MGGKDDEEIDEAAEELAGLLNKRESNFPMAVFVLTSLIMVPACVLGWLGVEGQNTCSNTLDGCEANCRNTWNLADKTYMSGNRGELACFQACEDEVTACRALAMNSLVGALLLACGLCCTMSLIQLVEAVMAAEAGGKQSSDVHPHSEEPILTDDQKRKKKTKKREAWIKLIGRACCCCPNWIKNRIFNRLLRLKIVPPKQTTIELIEHRCPTCDVPFDVEKKWKSAEVSGMEGAVCPICLNRVLGLL